MLGWKTHVAGTTSGHFTVNTVPKQLIHFNSGTMGNKRAQALESSFFQPAHFCDQNIHVLFYLLLNDVFEIFQIYFLW